MLAEGNLLLLIIDKHSKRWVIVIVKAVQNYLNRTLLTYWSLKQQFLCSKVMPSSVMQYQDFHFDTISI